MTKGIRFCAVLLSTACVPDRTPPLVSIDTPGPLEDVGGFRIVQVDVQVVDDRKAPIDLEVLADGVLIGSTSVSDCREPCRVGVDAFVADLPEGVAELEVQAFDSAGNGGAQASDVVEVFVADVPFVDAITVHDSEEAGFNGPNIEVEVHLEDETGVWLGCAALESVEVDDREFRGLSAPFWFDERRLPLHWSEVAGAPMRLVVVESDQGLHCPIPADLVEQELDDDDDLYGRTGLFDFDDLALGTADPALADLDDDPGFTGLVVDRGRPLGRWVSPFSLVDGT
jgi:hypothetical protein